MNPGMIPPELRALRQWVVWKTVVRDDKPTKPPFNPHTGGPARTHNQAGKMYDDAPEDTWGTFTDAIEGCRRLRMEGIGFVFTANDPYVGIDIDDCMTNGKPTPEAKEVVRLLNSYTERSPSGSGIHVIIRGKLPEGGRRRGDVELYDRARYFTMTGEPFTDRTQIADRQEELEELHAKIFGTAPVIAAVRSVLTLSDAEIIEKAKSAKNSSTFCSLYDGGCTSFHDGDDSRADMALCGMLAFYAGPDPDRIDRLFRSSALYRRKWDREDYRTRTIEKVLAGKTEFYSPTYSSSTRSSIRVNPETGEVVEGTPEDFRPTEAGSADRVLANHSTDLRHAYKQNIWYVWGGNRWFSDAQHLALKTVEDELRSVWQEAIQCTDEDRRKNLLKMALKSEANRYYQSVLTIMRHRTPVEARPEDFDADPFLLNCVNGTLDLKTGELRDYRRDDMITLMAGTTFNPEAECPTWLAFLKRVLPADDVREFFQRACGYALTGDTSEQCFFFLHGDGCNGKSTAVDALLAVMGEYGTQASPSLLLTDKASSKERDTVSIVGKRFVATVEIDQGRRLAESVVKSMTGGDRIRARQLYHESFDFVPTHKIFMAANHRPVIQGTDYAIWRRIMLIPFTEKITDEEKDYRLKEKLENELPGILAWATRGCLDWRQNGLRPPPAVIAATQEYRGEQDLIGRFLSECCKQDPYGSVRSAELIECYRQWCHTNGEIAQNSTVFGREMNSRGYEVVHERTGNARSGLVLSEEGKRYLAPRSGVFSNA